MPDQDGLPTNKDRAARAAKAIEQFTDGEPLARRTYQGDLAEECDHKLECIFDHAKVGDHECVLVCFKCRTCSHGRQWPHCCGVVEVTELKNA